MKKKHPLFKKNDKVTILTGKEKGKIGAILKVDEKKGRAIVEKVNLVKRHTKPGGKAAQGGIVEKEASIHLSDRTYLTFFFSGQDGDFVIFFK